ncbi:PP0621 family protein [Cupriavidus sp. 2KB_3]|uniref:PP0621 family protein n=1 Tax=Cupriavidus TaxID=106589 RepID=UPI0011F0211E|nr:PP0621 family protein [Cupriavidus campinensis]
MARIFLLLAVVLAIIWWLRQRAAARDAHEPPARPGPAQRKADGAAASEPMVQCAQCGVHLPRGEAIGWNGLHYCRRSHLPDGSEMSGHGDTDARP